MGGSAGVVVGVRRCDEQGVFRKSPWSPFREREKSRTGTNQHLFIYKNIQL